MMLQQGCLGLWAVGAALLGVIVVVVQAQNPFTVTLPCPQGFTFDVSSLNCVACGPNSSPDPTGTYVRETRESAELEM
jgi:hypothetical protein